VSERVCERVCEREWRGEGEEGGRGEVKVEGNKGDVTNNGDGERRGK